MDDKELAKYVGKKIKQYRVEKGLTQTQLGERIGKANNTISNYETGTISPEQDALFNISRTLGIRLDDLFPPMDIEDENDNFTRALQMSQDLDIKDMNFMKLLIEKTLSMKEGEREKFLDFLKFTMKYHEDSNED